MDALTKWSATAVAEAKSRLSFRRLALLSLPQSQELFIKLPRHSFLDCTFHAHSIQNRGIK